jgi:rRNA maturation protein Nop10
MVMQFLCPNGHKIHCGEERAGLAARCPKCGVKFRIPTPDELSVEDTDAPAADSPSRGPDVAFEATPSPIAVGAAVGQGQIEFVCPGGHLLHGPMGLQGQPGECPECGSKFRIPSYDELETDDEMPEPEPTPPPPIPQRAIGKSADDLIGTLEPVGELPGTDLGPMQPDLPMPETETQTPSAGPGSLATLFPMLWAHKADGAMVEICYGNGQRAAPERFFPALSRGDYAVFANQETDGSFTLTALAWSAISSVVVRRVKRLPSGGA